jgi:hypothetical protein
LEIISAARMGLPEYKKFLTGSAWDAAAAGRGEIA